MQQIRLVPKHKKDFFELQYVIKTDVNKINVTDPKRLMAIDLGEVNLVTAVTAVTAVASLRPWTRCWRKVAKT